MTTIDDLIRRLEAATGPDRGLDGEIAVASGQYDEHFQGRDGSRAHEGWVSRNGGARVPAPRYTGSIDATMSLFDPSWWYLIAKGRTRPDEPLYGCQIRRQPSVIDGTCGEIIAEAEHESECVCICIAALRARAATPSP